MTSVEELERLEKEMHKVVVADERYWRENDAKFRAVAQHASYDQFEQIVKASHLKPLDRKDKIGGGSGKCRGTSIWNSITLAGKKPTTTTFIDGSGQQPPSSSVKASQGGGTIKNIDEFYSLWRCLEIEERIDFMAELGHQNIARLFQSEIPPELLGEMLHTFLAFRPNPTDISAVVRTLGAVTGSKRFSLSVQFLSSVDRSAGSQLIEKLLTSLSDRQQDLAELGVTEYSILSIAEKLSISATYTQSGPVCTS